MIRRWRMALVALGAAGVGALALAAPAGAADVAVTPPLAVRGGGAELAFHIPDERAGAYTTKVELVVPEATPIGEVYPLSAADWAPKTTTRQLDQPTELIHGTTTTEVVSTITWIRMDGSAANPGQPVVLSVAVGPMPKSDRVVFTLVQTYSDGTVVRWSDQPGAGGGQPAHPAPTVTLVDQDAGASNGAGAGNAGNAGDAGAAPAAKKAGDDRAYGLLGAVVLVGLALAVGLEGWLIFRAAARRATVATATASRARRV